MSDFDARVAANRQLLTTAQAEGLGPTLKAYTRLAGPGWLQSAITLGGGSMAAALFLKAYDKSIHPVAGRWVIGISAVFLVLVMLGFAKKRSSTGEAS